MFTRQTFFRIIIFLIGIFLISPLRAENTGIIKGKVTEYSSKKPIEGAKVKVEKTKFFAFVFLTDKNGEYLIEDIPEGKYDITVEKEGYKPFTKRDVVVSAGKETIVNFELLPLSGMRAMSIPTEPFDKESVKEGKGVGKEYYPKAKLPTLPSEKTSVTPTKPDVVAKTDKLKPQEKLQAASHDDNEEFPYFLDFLEKNKSLKMPLHYDFSERYIIRVVDGKNQPIMNKEFEIVNEKNEVLWKAKTYSNGENIFFPYVMCPEEKLTQKLFIKTKDGKNEYYKPLEKIYQNLNIIQFNNIREDEKIPLDIAFILDTTGSMGDEIEKLKDTIYSIYTRIINLNPQLDIRFGMVIYRDRGDIYITKEFDFTSEIDKFQYLLDSVEAGGGGDGPEDIQSALEVTIKKLKWRDKAIKLGFVIGDAEPHTDYGQEYTYINATKDANSLGIKLYMIGASGLNITGEYIFRQIAALTYSQFIFMTYGEKGESEGTDIGKVSHHTGINFQSRNLDDLVVGIAQKEISHQIKKEEISIISIKPEDEKDYLNIRLDNLWQQIYKQLHFDKSHPMVAVLFPFETENPNLKELKEFISDMSIEYLLASGAIKLIEREKLELLLKEQAISATGLTEETEYSKLGKLLNSDIIFTGKIYYLGIERVLHVRAINVETGQILAAARVRM